MLMEILVIVVIITLSYDDDDVDYEDDDTDDVFSSGRQVEQLGRVGVLQQELCRRQQDPHAVLHQPHSSVWRQTVQWCQQ